MNNNIELLKDCEFQYKFWRVFDYSKGKELHTFPNTYNINQIKDIMSKFFNERYKSNEPVDLKNFKLEWCYSPGIGCFEKHIFVCTLEELLK